VELLNNWELILKRTLGEDAVAEAAKRVAAELDPASTNVCSEPAVITAIQEQARRLEQTAMISEATATKLQQKRLKEGIQEPSFNERLSFAVAAQCRASIPDIPSLVEKAAPLPRTAAGYAKRNKTSAARGPRKPKQQRLKEQRFACAAALLPLGTQLVGQVLVLSPE
jgi:hypothetical protein